MALAVSLQLFGLTPANAASVYSNVKYGPASGSGNLMDIYVPGTGAGPFPAVLLIHGGGWTKGDKSWFDRDAARLARVGIVGVSVNYRLAPAAVYPAQLDDVQAALAWIRAHAFTYKVDPRRIGALGASAGGHLAALLATYGVGSRTSGTRLSVVAAWSGIYDFMTMPGTGLVDGSKISTFLGCDVTTCPDKWADASPASHVDPTDPPIYMANGTAESIPSQQPEDMAAEVGAELIPYQLQWVPGSQHGTGYEAQVWAQTVSFLKTYLG